ncbi:MAG: DNA repair protein RecO, partial [Chloroflexota bacterium]
MSYDRFRTRKTEAIVLRRIDMGESDRLLTLFSKEYGKIKALSKGSRKPSSRQTGHVELFGRSKFLIAEGKTFDIVTQAESVEMYMALRDDLVRTVYASHAIELLDRFTEEEDKNAPLFQLLSDSLGWFADEENLLLAARYYELRLLSLTGFQPQLFNCVVSREPIEEEDQYFSAEMGGLLKPA